MLKVTDRFLGNTFTIDTDDANVDCPPQLATYIRGKQLRGKHSEPWLKWVDSHFVEMNQVFRKIEIRFGLASYLTNLATVGTLSEHPLSNPPAHNTRFCRVAAKRRNGINKPSGVN